MKVSKKLKQKRSIEALKQFKNQSTLHNRKLNATNDNKTQHNKITIITLI